MGREPLRPQVLHKESDTVSGQTRFLIFLVTFYFMLFVGCPRSTVHQKVTLPGEVKTTEAAAADQVRDLLTLTPEGKKMWKRIDFGRHSSYRHYSSGNWALSEVPRISALFPTDARIETTDFNALTKPEQLFITGWANPYVPDSMFDRLKRTDKKDKTALKALLQEYTVKYGAAEVNPVDSLIGPIINATLLKGGDPRDIYRLLDPETLKQWFKDYPLRRDQFVMEFLSPVTGKPLEYKHQNFSRGNAFISYLNIIPEAMKVIKTTAYDDPKMNPDRFHWFFVRLYGERGIVYENVWPHDKSSVEIEREGLKKVSGYP